MSATVEELWVGLAGSLRGGFRARGVSEADADDLVQETFLRVQSGLSGARDAERLEAWVQRVARNVLIDSRRRSSAQPADELDPAAPEDAPDRQREVAGWLAGLIEELDPEDGEVLRRTELAGERQADVAAALGLSLSAVKSRVRRGRAKMRQRLEACCRFEFDRRGGLVDYTRRDDDCCGEPG